MYERLSPRGRTAILLATLWIGCGPAALIGATPASATASEVVAQSPPSAAPGDDAAHVVASVRAEAPQLAAGVIVIALGLSVLLLSAVVGRFPDALRRRVSRATALREIARCFLANAGMTFPGELARVTGLSRPEAGLGNRALVAEGFATMAGRGTYRLSTLPP